MIIHNIYTKFTVVEGLKRAGSKSGRQIWISARSPNMVRKRTAREIVEGQGIMPEIPGRAHAHATNMRMANRRRQQSDQQEGTLAQNKHPNCSDRGEVPSRKLIPSLTIAHKCECSRVYLGPTEPAKGAYKEKGHRDLDSKSLLITEL